jgi:protoheme IX farnesyltransferase
VVTGGVSVESVAMFILIFMWTPPHFWALSLFVHDDYSDAGVPMLTVTHGTRVTRNHILGYTFALFLIAIGIAFTSIGGPVYLATALVLNALFLLGAIKLKMRTNTDAIRDQYSAERKFFRLSLVYLFASFSALFVDALLRRFDLLTAWPVVI